jgi:hypothetical protein
LFKRLPLSAYIDRLDDVSSNVYTSSQLESVLGSTAEEWPSDGQLFLRVIDPDDRERVLASTSVPTTAVSSTRRSTG